MRSINLLSGLLLFGYWSFGQEVNLNNLIVPISPGLVILDKAPSSIEKPTSPKTLGVSVLRLLKQNEGALDFTPYWFWNHNNYSFKDYIESKCPLPQTLNLSVAASQGDSSSYFSAGLRAQVFRKYSKEKVTAIKEKQKKIVDELSVNPDNLSLQRLQSLKDELATLTATPTISVELAGAMAGFSPDNKFTNLSDNRYGAWLNIAYTPSDSLPISALGVFRYTKAIDGFAKGADSTFFDFGLAASYQSNKFDLQLEYINRNDIENGKHYYRMTLVANYLVANNIVIVASFGKNFSEVKNIIALFGVKFGIANEKLNLQNVNP